MTPKKAILSVSDKTGIVEFGKALAELNIEILSTGGTAQALQEAGVPVTSVSDYTGFPEMMDGRVKTLHPKIHAGLLALRDNEDHMRQLQEQGIDTIDIVAINLYPFKETISREGVSLEEAIENIDIGGPTMLRAAAKNYNNVAVITQPEDYQKVIDEIKAHGEVSSETKAALGLKVFQHTADYDTAIETYLTKNICNEDRITLKFTGGQELRYGENWHQQAKFFKEPGVSEPCFANGNILHGKALSYNNFLDGDAALETVKQFIDTPAVAVIKHTNPCGLATGETLREAMEAAWEGDSISAFGSVIAVTQVMDLPTAEFLQDKFVEIVIAPAFEEDALELLKSKSENIRLIELPELMLGEDDSQLEGQNTYRYITGGMLVQSRDIELLKEWREVTGTPFPDEKLNLAKFTWKAAKHTKSNAIMLGWEYKPGYFQIVGMGAGQPNRLDSLRKLAVTKAQENFNKLYEKNKPEVPKIKYIRDRFAECVLASDAFFPFDDTVRQAAKYQIKYIVQPGGSARDNEVINACNELGLSMAFTGTRHFMH
ncbi:MAG: bifunctional phosphoribosylaminoimidazolecarboxamide formyltransferase/IMP cyclohydrolase [Thermoplasmata archaeon]|nr:MAG: bifunctional phosphoribosylaminoimidazolecarboxamide formyltransferase/IMP cyclohydrolase [Thermoplasmata archaeon]